MLQENGKDMVNWYNLFDEQQKNKGNKYGAKDKNQATLNMQKPSKEVKPKSGSWVCDNFSKKLKLNKDPYAAL